MTPGAATDSGKPTKQGTTPKLRDATGDKAPEDASTPSVSKAVRTVNDLRKQRFRRLAIRLLLGVVLPTVISAVYYGLIATPKYESVASFTVQSADGGGVPSLELLAAVVPGNSTTRDAMLLQAYVRSRDMLRILEEDHGYRDHMSGSDVDYISRVPHDASFEDRYEAYLENVSVDYDNQSGAITLRVRTFAADKARDFSQAVIAAGEAMVNRMMEEARRDRIALAEREVLAGEQRLSAARLQIAELQTERAELNPVQSAAAILAVRGALEGDLASARAELSALRATLQPTAPQVMAQQQRVSALSRQVEAQSARLAGAGDEGLNATIASFEPAVAEKEFAERAYLSAVKSLELARIEADRQHRYVVTVATPSLPDRSTHPKVLLSVLTVFVLALAIMGVGALLFASIREHANL